MPSTPATGPHYAVAMHLPTAQSIEVGALGSFDFPAGDYVYVGRAKSGFDARLARHRRTAEKTLRWHIDYLRDRADWLEARVPETDGECALASEIAELPDAARFIDGFGASDCGCEGHLIHFEGRCGQLPGARWSGDGLRAEFLRRPNRFVVRARCPDSGETVRAYLPNTARLTELLEEERPMLLEPADDPSRSTDYTVRRIWDGAWVSIEATRAEQMVEKWLATRESFPEIGGIVDWDGQVDDGEGHRFDFRLRRDPEKDVWLEVKSLSRCFDGDALLSGTPSSRGIDHLDRLGDLAEAGDPAALAFVIQRDDPERLVLGNPTAEADVDPDWLAAVRRARRRGVTIVAFACRVTAANAWIDRQIPVCDVNG